MKISEKKNAYIYIDTNKKRQCQKQMLAIKLVFGCSKAEWYKTKKKITQVLIAVTNSLMGWKWLSYDTGEKSWLN